MSFPKYGLYPLAFGVFHFCVARALDAVLLPSSPIPYGGSTIAKSKYLSGYDGSPYSGCMQSPSMNLRCVIVLFRASPMRPLCTGSAFFGCLFIPRRFCGYFFAGAGAGVVVAAHNSSFLTASKNCSHTCLVGCPFRSLQNLLYGFTSDLRIRASNGGM